MGPPADDARALRKDLLYHAGWFNARQLLIKTLILIGEAPVLHAEQMQQRRLEVAHMNGVFDNVIAELIRLAVHQAALDAATGQPQAEATGVMITAVTGGRQLTL